MRDARCRADARYRAHRHLHVALEHDVDRQRLVVDAAAQRFAVKQFRPER
jgi:hypothetical protein